MRLHILSSIPLVVLCACPGSLDNPDRFTGASTCRLDVQAEIFAVKCGTSACHAGGGASPAVGLELVDVSPADLVARPAASVSQHPTASCEGSGLIIDPTDMGASLLLSKLDAATCGELMPQIGELTSEEVDCIEDFVMQAVNGM